MSSLNDTIGDITSKPSFDWARMKRGLQEIVRRHPHSLTAKAKLFTMSLAKGDYNDTTAVDIFRQ